MYYQNLLPKSVALKVFKKSKLVRQFLKNIFFVQMMM